METRKSLGSVEPAIALVHHDFVTPLMAPAGLIVVPAVDVVDNHLPIPMSFPVLPVAVPEALDSHHSRGMALDNHSPNRGTIARVSSVYRYSSGNRTAANHNLCRHTLSVKRGCHQRQTCYQRPCRSAGLHRVLDWWTGEPHQTGNARGVPAAKYLLHIAQDGG